MENHLRRLANETGYAREILLKQIGTMEVKDTRQFSRQPRNADPAPTETVLAEQALISLLAANLIPRDMLQPKDFSENVHEKLAEWLISGKSVNAYIGALSDEEERKRALRALNYSPLPDEREEAMKMAENCLRTIQKNRVTQRIEQIERDKARLHRNRR